MEKTNKEVVTLTIKTTKEWLANLDQLSKLTNKNKSLLVRNALQDHYLNTLQDQA